MAGHAMFNFSARFLAPTKPQTPQSGRRSKLLTRRAALRFQPKHMVIPVNGFVTEPAEAVPEVVPAPEITATPPTTAAAQPSPLR